MGAARRRRRGTADYYMVREERSGAKQRCDTNECVFRKLKTGGNYSFRVQAFNRWAPATGATLSRTATADTQPAGSRTSGWPAATTVRSPSPGTSRPPTPPGSSTTRSRGRVEAPSSSTGSTTSFPVTGLDNNQQYVFTIKAAERGRLLAAPRRPGRCSPLGTPPAPAAPAVTDLESGASRPASGSPGRRCCPRAPARRSTPVSYTNGVTSGTVPGCQRLASLTCTHAGVPYDGLTYTYTVVAANQPGDQPGKRSQPSPALPSRRSVVPADWGAFTVVATGSSRRPGPLHGAGLPRHDQQGGDPGGRDVNRTFEQQTGTRPLVHVPSNEQPYPVQLRVCNEEAPRAAPERRAERPDLRTPRRQLPTSVRASTARRDLDDHRRPATATRRRQVRINGGAREHQVRRPRRRRLQQPSPPRRLDQDVTRST